MLLLPQHPDRRGPPGDSAGILGGTPLGAPLVGWAAELFGARASLVVGGVISAAAAIGVALLLARARGARIRSYLRPALARATP